MAIPPSAELKLPRELPAATVVTATDMLVGDNGVVVQKVTPPQIVDAATPLASQSEAEAGTDNNKRMTPLRVAQAISSQAVASATIAADTGATLVGAIGGLTVQAEIDNLKQADSDLQDGVDAATADATTAIGTANAAASAVGSVTGIANAALAAVGAIEADTGSALVGTTGPDVTSVPRTVYGKLYDIVSPSDEGFSPSASASFNATALQKVSGEFPADTVQRGALIFQPGPQVSVGSEVLLHRKSMTLNGQNTVIKWDGSGTGNSIFRITDSSRLKICDMVLLGDMTNPPLAAIRYFRNASGDTTGTNELCSVENVFIGRKYGAETGLDGSLQNGILIDGTDGNNDQFVFNNIAVGGASVAGINFSNAQSVWSTITNSVMGSCGTGCILGCNMQLSNVQFNRNTVADVRGVRNTRCWITGMHAENSNIFIHSTGGAGFFVNGGRMMRSSATGSNTFRVEAGGPLVLENLWVNNAGAGVDSIYYRPGSTTQTMLKVRNCEIQRGSERDYWDVEAGFNSDIDIQHGAFHWKTTRRYLDRAVTPAATAAGASQLLTATAVVESGAAWNVSYSKPLADQHLTPCPDSASVVRARIFNPTAASITLDAGRLRFMDLGDHILASVTTNIDAPTMANNTGASVTVTVPGVKLGDFVGWGALTSYTNTIVTAYVSAENTVTLRLHNATGGTSNPPPTDFRVYKLSDFGNFKNNLAYTPSAIANATTETLTVSVPGAQLGGHTFVTYSADLKGLVCTAYVSGADTVTILLSNYTGSDVTLDAGYFRAMVAF